MKITKIGNNQINQLADDYLKNKINEHNYPIFQRKGGVLIKIWKK